MMNDPQPNLSVRVEPNDMVQYVHNLMAAPQLAPLSLGGDTALARAAHLRWSALNRAFVDGAGRTPALAGITYRIADFVRTAIWPHPGPTAKVAMETKNRRFGMARRVRPTPAIDWAGTLVRAL